jgi:large subunit ribosomal protein L30
MARQRRRSKRSILREANQQTRIQDPERSEAPEEGLQDDHQAQKPLHADHSSEEAQSQQPDLRPLLRIKWVKSAIGYAKDQKETIRSLGLRKLQRTVEHRDHPAIRGMIRKVIHLVQVEEVAHADAL